MPPYDESGYWSYADENYIKPRKRVVAIHRKILTTRKGIHKVVELLKVNCAEKS